MDKKKVFAVAMSTMLAMAAPVTALAETEIYKEGETGTTMYLSYNVSQSYTVRIPADIKFSGSSLEKQGSVSAENVLIPNGKTLKVSVESANGKTDDGNAYKLVCNSSVIPYTIKNDGTLVDLTSPALSIESGKTSDSITLDFATTADDIAKATQSGDHTDTLTFSVTVDNS